jgi:hypothetical protein
MEATDEASATRLEPRFKATLAWSVSIARVGEPILGFETRRAWYCYTIPTAAHFCVYVIRQQTIFVLIQRERYTHPSLQNARSYHYTKDLPPRAFAATWAIISATRFFWQHRRRDNSALWKRAPHSFCLFLVHRSSLYHHPGTLNHQTSASFIDRMHGGAATRGNAADFLASRPGSPFCTTTS